ncbi:MAG TPA: APC family permease [Candidatus Limnocylindrales bacterium]
MTDSRPLHGRKLGDRRVVVERPHARYFRYLGPGVLEAKLEAQAPRTAQQRRMAALRGFLFGRPISSAMEMAERLPKWKALPIFSSDVMSSVAYASEASLFTLAAVGAVAFNFLMPISLLVIALLAVVTISYRQTIRAYPNGGGSYIVAHANLGVLPGLIAAASLLVDYVLTVSVSVSSGVFNLASALTFLQDVKVPLIIVFIILVTTLNLRGLRDSGTMVASPAYIFIGSMMLMIGIGLIRTVLGNPPHVGEVNDAIMSNGQTLTVFLLARAFADGCSAMTGTEAVANGVPAFKPPEWKNAQATMLMMSALLGTMFLGMSVLVGITGAHVSTSVSILSQIAGAVYGSSPLYWILIFATMGILVLAAQTSFADFPRLASILSRDGYFPRQFALRGERLSFNSGIVLLSLLSVVLVVAFNGNVNALIPLYAIGVFTSFTLSQSGMVRHWWVERGPNWRRSAIINGTGACVTAVVVVVQILVKFTEGAWIIIVVVPILVLLMLFIKHEYDQEGRGLEVAPDVVFGPAHRRQRVVVAAQAMSRAVVQAVRVGQAMGEEVQVVHVTLDHAEGEQFRERVERQLPGARVVLVESPYRALVRPFVRYLEVSQAEDPERLTIVLLPEHLPRHWWDRMLFNQNVHRIRAALVGRKDFVVLDTPYRRGT